MLCVSFSMLFARLFSVVTRWLPVQLNRVHSQFVKVFYNLKGGNLMYFHVEKYISLKQAAWFEVFFMPVTQMYFLVFPNHYRSVWSSLYNTSIWCYLINSHINQLTIYSSLLFSYSVASHFLICFTCSLFPWGKHLQMLKHNPSVGDSRVCRVVLHQSL